MTKAILEGEFFVELPSYPKFVSEAKSNITLIHGDHMTGDLMFRIEYTDSMQNRRWQRFRYNIEKSSAFEEQSSSTPAENEA